MFRVEPSGYLATLPGQDGATIYVGPFESREAAADFCALFSSAAEVSYQVMIGPMYPPAKMLLIAINKRQEFDDDRI